MSVNYHEVDDLFSNEGWREPGDDASRLAAYVLTVLGAILGFVGAIYLSICAADPVRFFEMEGQTVESWQPVLLGAFAVLSAALAIFCTYFLAKESRHWNLRNLNAERIIAGLFLLSISVGIIGVWMLQSGGSEAVIGTVAIWALAGGLFLVALVSGLLVAGFQFLSKRPRKLGGGRIAAKYALDDKMQRIDNHPCPSEDGLIPVVEVEFFHGELTTFRATPSAYDLAKPGIVGTAFGSGKSLKSFRPERLVVPTTKR